MKKKVLLLSTLSSITFLISSCGISDKNSPESCRFEVSQAIDKGNYDYAIQKLEKDPTCGGAFTEEEGKINLAAAYIGKAGFDITSIVNDILKSGDVNSDTDNYALFAQAIAKRASGKTVTLLEKAKNLYKEIYGNIDCSDKQTLESMPDIVKDACFYSGLTDTAKATTSLTLLIGGDETNPEDIANLVEKWVEAKKGNTQTTCDETDINGNGIPDSADATACALEYATELSKGNNPPIQFNCDIDSTQIESKEEKVKFDPISTTFTNLDIVINPKTECNSSSSKKFKRLIYNIGGSIYTTAITNGYCKTDHQTQCSIEDIDCYPCPVVKEDETQSKEPVSTADSIIETINEGTDAILAVIPDNEESSADEIKEKIVEFKKDLCSTQPTACLCDTNGDGVGDKECENPNEVEYSPDVDIKLPSQDPTVQQLIADYLQNK